jgi:dTMP kinase
VTATAAPGRFITLEGVDGAGKSTHLQWIADCLAARGHRVVMTREPGGTSLGEALRDLLLATPMTHETETLLMFAARQEHVAQVIAPALARGDWVLCDRFTDATFAYQGGGHGVSAALIAALATRVHADWNPDLTLLFDVPPAVSRARLERAASEGRTLDKFEREAQAFFDRVRATYLDRARAEPARFRVIDAARPVADVRADIARIVATL